MRARTSRQQPSMFLFVLVLSVYCLSTASAALTQDSAPAATACSNMLTLQIPEVEITEVKLIFAEQDRCAVIGYVKSRIVFEVLLPNNWNGKMYFAGNGGFAGSLTDTSLGLGRGYATVSTDTGHQGDVLDGSFAWDNRQAELDYGFRAVHYVTMVAKRIITAYYGRPPRFSYFDGCSNGGRQGLMEAEKYPADFNGIVAGCPALEYTGMMIGFNWNMQAQQATETSTLVSFEKFRAIREAVLQECDALDGVSDGLVDDPRRCQFKPDKLLCKSAENAGCLTPPQIEALNKIESGPKDTSGRTLYPGFPLAALTPDVFWGGWLAQIPDLSPAFQFLFVDQSFRFIAFANDNPDYDWRAFNFDTDPKRLNGMAKILNATNPDLSRFHQLGGKLLLHQAWSDTAVAPTRVIDFYQTVRKRLGNPATDNTVRLFMVPGMLHCAGGPGPNSFDYLTALEQWVENGIIPSRIEATHFNEQGKPDRTRPLCPYPKVARYKGNGSINATANFVCLHPGEEQ